MQEITQVNIKARHQLLTGYHAVVQTASVSPNTVYALQLRHAGQAIYVLQGNYGSEVKLAQPVLILTDSAGGHTQTWAPAGRQGQWFIGTKPSHSHMQWDQQIARVDLTNMGTQHCSHLEFPRLGYLNRVGNYPVAGTAMKRVEAAVSPDLSRILIASLEYNGTGHFTIYPLAAVNKVLDQAAKCSPASRYVNLSALPYLEAFTVARLSPGWLNSVQGYAIDNPGNIYISSQRAPGLNSQTGQFSPNLARVIKIPVGGRADQIQWTCVNLSARRQLALTGTASELEGIQVIGEDEVYLTVAYHMARMSWRQYIAYTDSNWTYRLSWGEKGFNRANKRINLP